MGKVIWLTRKPWKSHSRVVVLEEHSRKNSAEQRKRGDSAYVEIRGHSSVVGISKVNLTSDTQKLFPALARVFYSVRRLRQMGKKQQNYTEHVLYFPFLLWLALS